MHPVVAFFIDLLYVHKNHCTTKKSHAYTVIPEPIIGNSDKLHSDIAMRININTETDILCLVEIKKDLCQRDLYHSNDSSTKKAFTQLLHAAVLAKSKGCLDKVVILALGSPNVWYVLKVKVEKIFEILQYHIVHVNHNLQSYNSLFLLFKEEVL